MDTDADRAFAHVTARLVREPGVEQGRAFHAPGLKADGKIFAMLVKEELVVKLPAPRCVDLVARAPPGPSSPAAAA